MTSQLAADPAKLKQTKNNSLELSVFFLLSCCTFYLDINRDKLSIKKRYKKATYYILVYGQIDRLNELQ